jgi:type IV pilus assembly protein PilC
MAQAQNVTFQWEGLDKKGSRIKGETTASTEILARAELRRQGINPLKVRKKPRPLFGGKKKITPKDIAVFLRQMATMIEAGVPLVQAFEIVGRGHENPSMQELILSMKADVESGTTFAAALGKHPKYFDDLVVNLVHAGEQSGSLETLLDKIATYKEKTESLKAKIRKALFYPAAVLVVAFIVTAILLLFVVPTFQDLFQGFGADLPVFTLFVIGISEFLQSWWWAVFGGLIAAVFAFRQAHLRSEAFRRRLDLLSLKIPVIGEILRKAAIARFSRTLSTMFSAGVPLVEAMESVAGATGNALYREGDAPHPRRDCLGHPVAGGHAQHRPVSQHGGADGGHRRGVGGARRHAGQGGRLLRGGGGQRGRQPLQPHRAHDHGLPGHRGGRAGHRHVPADLPVGAVV